MEVMATTYGTVVCLYVEAKHVKAFLISMSELHLSSFRVGKKNWSVSGVT